MRARFLSIGAAAAVFLYIAALVFYRLDAFPGLHGDEAWVGIFASRMRTLGVSNRERRFWEDSPRTTVSV